MTAKATMVARKGAIHATCSFHSIPKLWYSAVCSPASSKSQQVSRAKSHAMYESPEFAISDLHFILQKYCWLSYQLVNTVSRWEDGVKVHMSRLWSGQSGNLMAKVWDRWTRLRCNRT